MVDVQKHQGQLFEAVEHYIGLGHPYKTAKEFVLEDLNEGRREYYGTGEDNNRLGNTVSIALDRHFLDGEPIEIHNDSMDSRKNSVICSGCNRRTMPDCEIKIGGF